MKTMQSRAPKRPKAKYCREERLYPNMAESQRLEQIYKQLKLDTSVLRAQPADSQTFRRR